MQLHIIFYSSTAFHSCQMSCDAVCISDNVCISDAMLADAAMTANISNSLITVIGELEDLHRFMNREGRLLSHFFIKKTLLFYNIVLWRDSVTRFLTSGVFHISSSPGPVIIPLAWISVFQKFRIYLQPQHHYRYQRHQQIGNVKKQKPFILLTH